MTKTDIANRALAKIGDKRITSLDDPNDKNARLAKLHYGDARDEALRAGFWSFAMVAVRLVPEVAATTYLRTLSGVENAGFDGDYRTESEANGKPAWITGISLNPPSIVWTGTKWVIDHPLNDGVIFESTEDVAAPELVEEWTAVGLGAGAPVFTTLLSDELHPWAEAFALPSTFLKLRKVTDATGRKVDKFELRRANGKRCLLADVDDLWLHHVARIDTPAEYDPQFSAALSTLLASKLARSISGSDQLETTLLQRYETVDLPAARTADGHDSHSDENHPLAELLAGDLTRGSRGNFFGEDY